MVFFLQVKRLEAEQEINYFPGFGQGVYLYPSALLKEHSVVQKDMFPLPRILDYLKINLEQMFRAKCLKQSN